MSTMPRKRWTSHEDEVLTGLIRQHGDKRGREGRWHDIAKCLPGRTAKDCRKRWFHSLDPSLRKGRWTGDEDQVLLQAYARLGPAWKRIALLLPGRKDDQCAKRYTEILDPSVHRRLQRWTQEEDDYLRAKVHELGHRWALISAGLTGRPPLTCRNRWRALSKKAGGDGIQTESRSSVDASYDSTSGPGVASASSDCGLDGRSQPSASVHGSPQTSSPDGARVASLLDGPEFDIDIPGFESLQTAETADGMIPSDLAISGHAATLPGFRDSSVLATANAGGWPSPFPTQPFFDLGHSTEQLADAVSYQPYLPTSMSSRLEQESLPRNRRPTHDDGPQASSTSHSAPNGPAPSTPSTRPLDHSDTAPSQQLHSPGSLDSIYHDLTGQQSLPQPSLPGLYNSQSRVQHSGDGRVMEVHYHFHHHHYHHYSN